MPVERPSLTTPVVLLVYNRPAVTGKMMESLRAVRPSRLLVVADGPRADRPDDAERCAEVRALIDQSIDWPCEVSRDYAPRNLGCGARIFSGLQWAFTQVPEAIVLEEDCVAAPSFFEFCTEMLARYRDEPRVHMIAGSNFSDAAPASSQDYFFSRHFAVWGWATWRRALAGYSLNLSWWRTELGPRDLRRFCPDPLMHQYLCDVLDAQQAGAVNTWDVQWWAHGLRRGALSIVPAANLVSNIGVEGSHTEQLSKLHWRPRGEFVLPANPPPPLAANESYDRAVMAAHRPPGGWLLGHTLNQLVRTRVGRWLWQRRRAWRSRPRVENTR